MNEIGDIKATFGEGDPIPPPWPQEEPDTGPPDDEPPEREHGDMFVRGDHVELGSRMLAEITRRGETVFAEGQLYIYTADTGLFVEVEVEEQSRILQSFAGASRISEDGKMSPLRLKRSDVSGSVALAHDQVAKPDFFADAPAGVAFEDCFVALGPNAVERRPHSFQNRARFGYPFPYTPGAAPERFLRFLGECFAGTDDAAERILCIREYVGSSLFGIAARYQRALVMHGDGANGKGVLTKTLDRAMPQGSCVAIPPQQWSNEYRLAMLAGKRLNIVSELPEADIIDSEAFKSIVAGDATTGRRIREAPFTFAPVAGHVFAANRLPGTADQTHGFWRRMLVIGFPNIVPVERQDPALDEKLAAELPGVVAWLIQGAADAMKRGKLTTPTSSLEAVANWQRVADQVRVFLAERTRELPAGAEAWQGTNATELYKAYKAWAANSGHKQLSSTSFGLRLAQIGVPKQTTRAGILYDVELSTTAGTW
jgi:putative DNA primase/helicase